MSEHSADILEKIVDHCGVVALRCDRQGRVVYINNGAEKLLGHSRRDIVGKKLIDIAPNGAQHRIGCEEALAEVFLRASYAEYRFSISVGELERDYLMKLAPHSDANGEVPYASAVGVDVSSQRLKIREAHEVDRNKRGLLTLVAHEMRNPLSTLSAGLKVLSKEIFEGRAAEAVQMMTRQVEYLARLVEDLLDVSRINQGQIILSKKPIQLQEVIEAALETSRSAIERGNHSLKVTLPEGKLTFRGDSQRLCQALVNLLDNASKYTPPGGEISLHATQDASGAIITISDNGVGIPASEVPHIFDLFRQVKRDDGATKIGLGVGLYLVRMIVEAHGGKVSVSSSGNGAGSTFTIRVPHD
jgi:PAS domain S-box-containing protein